MSNQILKFTIQITLIVGFVFLVHCLVQAILLLPLFQNQIIPAYIVNLLLAIATFIILIKLAKTRTKSLGFVFMGASFFKFLLFFILFYPSYKSDGLISKAEFSAFFIPYAISLLVEVLSLIKILNNSEET